VLADRNDKLFAIQLGIGPALHDDVGRFGVSWLAAIDDLLPRLEKIDGQFLQYWTACFQSVIRDHQTIGRQDQTVISEQDVVGGSRLEDIGIAEGN
jgi:hypothetical protein